MKRWILCFLFCLCLEEIQAVNSQEIPLEKPEINWDSLVKDVLDKINQFEKNKELNYSDQINTFRKDMNVLIDQKKSICFGETIGPESFPKKLTRSERRACLLEVKKTQKKFIQAMYRARKAWLSQMHQSRLKQLDEDEQRVLKDLETSFKSKKARRRRR